MVTLGLLLHASTVTVTVVANMKIYYWNIINKICIYLVTVAMSAASDILIFVTISDSL